jgi:hypothetical protein
LTRRSWLTRLWITDPAAPEPRPTKDVDVVVEVASRLAWHNFEERLRVQGLRNDSSSQVICRWVAGSGEDELLIDAMPSDARRYSASRIAGRDRHSIVPLPLSCHPAGGFVRSRRPT